MQSHTDEMGDTGVMDNLLEALQSGKLFTASTGGPTTVGGGRGRRPPRRDHNGMMGKLLFMSLNMIELDNLSIFLFF